MAPQAQSQMSVLQMVQPNPAQQLALPIPLHVGPGAAAPHHVAAQIFPKADHVQTPVDRITLNSIPHVPQEAPVPSQPVHPPQQPPLPLVSVATEYVRVGDSHVLKTPPIVR